MAKIAVSAGAVALVLGTSVIWVLVAIQRLGEVLDDQA